MTSDEPYSPARTSTRFRRAIGVPRSMACSRGAQIACSVTALALVLSIAACSDDDDDGAKTGNGVNDVRASCEVRAKWNRNGNDCIVCEAAVISPPCECPSLKAFGGACLDQANARASACAEEVKSCVFKCDQADCNCIDSCYANGDACKKAAAARDGCIAEACAPYCK